MKIRAPSVRQSLIKIRACYGDLRRDAPLVARAAERASDSRGLYALSALMLVGSLVVFGIVYLLTGIFQPGSIGTADILIWRFDVAYYSAILSFLWIHYYHDHFLFTDFEALAPARSR